jgi:hypothetical protein
MGCNMHLETIFLNNVSRKKNVPPAKAASRYPDISPREIILFGGFTTQTPVLPSNKINSP